MLLILIMFAFLPSAAFAWSIEAAAGYWLQMPSGNLSYDADGISGTTLDFKSDLKYRNEYKPYGRIKAELPLFFPNIYLMATPMEFQGSGQKNIVIFFGGQGFNANIPIDSKLKLDHYDLALYYSLPFLKKATADVLNVEIGFNARVIDFDAQASNIFVSASTHSTILVPMVYAGLQVVPFKYLSIEAEGRGMAYGSSSYLDVIGRAKIKIYGPLFVGAGYRYETIKIDQSGVHADVNFSGPFAEIGLRF